MSFFSKLGHIFSPNNTAVATSVGAAAVGALNPGLGALVQMIGNAAYWVETTAGPIPGEEKKAEVKRIIDVSSPVVLATLAAVAGKTIEQPEALAPALDRLIDDVVTLFHVLGIFQRRSVTANTGMTTSPAIPTAG